TELRERYGWLGAVYGWLYSERDWHYRRMQEQEQLEEELKKRDLRLERYLLGVDSLRGVPILVNSVGWEAGFPLCGRSPLSRWRARDPAARPLWCQSVGNKRGQCWMGEFRSLLGSAPLKFVPPGGQLPKDRWTDELNFLAWQPYQGEQQADLPEKVKI